MNLRILGILLFAASQSACGGSTHYEYESLGEARQDKTAKAAAIPLFVPASARSIAGSYHVETNDASIEFSFDKAHLGEVTAGFQRAEKNEADRIAEEIGRRSWKQPPTTSSLDLYLRTGPEHAREVLAIDKAASRAFWLGIGHID